MVEIRGRVRGRLRLRARRNDPTTIEYCHTFFKRSGLIDFAYLSSKLNEIGSIVPLGRGYFPDYSLFMLEVLPLRGAPVARV
jgi:hypothetical protein